MCASGDQILVIAGKYKGNTATYLSNYGKVMCSVYIIGQRNQQWNIWLTSIQHRSTAKGYKAGTKIVDCRKKEDEASKRETKAYTEIDEELKHHSRNIGHDHESFSYQHKMKKTIWNKSCPVSSSDLILENFQEIAMQSHCIVNQLLELKTCLQSM